MGSSGGDRVARAASARQRRGRLGRRTVAGLDLEDAERWTVGARTREQWHRDVVNRHAAFGGAFELAAVRVAVEDHGDRIAADRLLEAARSEERVNLERLTVDRRLDRRIVEQRDDLFGPQPRQRRLELEGLVDRFVHELLDDGLAPRRERVPSEAAAEALDAGDPDAGELARVAVEDDHAGVAQNM